MDPRYAFFVKKTFFYKNDYYYKMGIITDYSNVICQPASITTKLYLHQLASVYAMNEIETRKKKVIPESGMTIKADVGMLGDGVGSGKTLTVLALVAIAPHVEPIMTKRCIARSTHVEKYYFTSKKAHPITLCVVPHGILKQWQHAISTQTTLRCFTITGKFEVKQRDDFVNYQIVLVSNTMYKRFYLYLSQFYFSRLIIDEVDTIDIGRLVPNVSFIWYISASYTKIPYKFLDKYELSTQAYVDHFIVYNSAEQIRASIQLPDIVEKTIIIQNPVTINLLHGCINKSVLTYLYADDISSAISSLQTDVNTEDNIIDCVLRDLQIKLDNALAKKQCIENTTYKYAKDKETHLNQKLLEINELESNMQKIKARLSLTDYCAICYEDNIQYKTIVKNCCQKIFCYRCIVLWLSDHNICPACKQNLCLTDLLTVNTGDNIPENMVQPVKTNKLSAVLDIINNTVNGKFLVFSDNDMAFKDIASRIANCRILCGTSSTINSIVENYKTTTSVNTLLLNARRFCAGLNLENTTDIIIYHKLEDGIKTQVIGRGQRLGRTQPLRVWQILYESEL